MLERLVAGNLFLGQQCSACRGPGDILHKENNTSYLKLVKLSANVDSIMAEHLRRIREKDGYIHCLRKGMQNQLI